MHGMGSNIVCIAFTDRIESISLILYIIRSEKTEAEIIASIRTKTQKHNTHFRWYHTERNMLYAEKYVQSS